ncbi:MAG TPA: hypothetical protein VKT76_03860 [Bradyrhizobium sp.]|nr:hypothetical protein [Bradyrhizobium sp.]
MTFLTTTQNFARHPGKDLGGHFFAIVLICVAAIGAIGLVGYLLWPTWEPDTSSGPTRLPVSIGSTLFNVPAASIRMKIQHHSGPQERIDLSFKFPSLDPPDAPKHVSAAEVDEAMQPIDRIFLSIAAHHDSLAPEMRVRTIFPRYLDQASTTGEDGLTIRAFRDNSPYSGEDLFSSSAPHLTARCTREGATPGMCLSERRVEGADLIFRFPRAWLTHWREVAEAMDRLTEQLRGPK